ncbi:MAG: NFACT family protein, partial [Eubacterium sp.]|nr:NFACT family protein [Eubacterium sp.]
MALDGIFLSILKTEIEDAVLGARVDKIYQPSKDELLFSFRTFDGVRKVMLSARADSARIHLTNQYAENPKNPPMLTMLLRKRLGGARLSEIKQEGFERILTLVFDAKNDLGDPVKYSLIIEIMGRHSNIILVDGDGVIVECVKRIDETKSGVREVLPGLRYELPPAQKKMNILSDSIKDIDKAITASNQPKAKAALNVLQGVSPLVARELENGMGLYDLRNSIANPEPTVVIIDKPKDFTFFKPVQYGGLAEYKSFDTCSELIDYYYYEQVKHERIKQRSNDLFKRLSVLRERAIRKALNRKNELEECKDKDKLKEYGDLISTYLYTLEKGSPFYDVEDFYHGGETVRIPADIMLTPAQNAQKYYKEYRKKQVAEDKLKIFIREAEDEAEYLDTVIDELSRAETDAEITAIKNELHDSGFLSKRAVKKSREKKLPPKKYISTDGFTVLVGRNNVQNDELTLRIAKNYDMWFHVKDAAGSHVIAVSDKAKPFTDKLIRQAAMLAAYNSKAHASSNVAVDYTIVKNVHKPNGAKPGMVIYDNYNTEYVTPNEEELS